MKILCQVWINKMLKIYLQLAGLNKIYLELAGLNEIYLQLAGLNKIVGMSEVK